MKRQEKKPLVYLAFFLCSVVILDAAYSTFPLLPPQVMGCRMAMGVNAKSSSLPLLPVHFTLCEGMGVTVLSCFSTVLLCIGHSPLEATAPVQSSMGCSTWQGTCFHLGSSPQAAASKACIHVLWPGGLHSCSVEVQHSPLHGLPSQDPGDPLPLGLTGLFLTLCQARRGEGKCFALPYTGFPYVAVGLSYALQWSGWTHLCLAQGHTCRPPAGKHLSVIVADLCRPYPVFESKMSKEDGNN